MISNSSKNSKKYNASKPKKNKKSKRKKSKSKSESSRSGRRQLPLFNKFCRIFDHKISKVKCSKTKKNIKSKPVKISSLPEKTISIVSQPKPDTERIIVNEYSQTPTAPPSSNLHKDTTSDKNCASASNVASPTTDELSDAKNSANISKEDSSRSLLSRSTVSSVKTSSDSKSDTKAKSWVGSISTAVNENAPEIAVKVPSTVPSRKWGATKIEPDDESPFGPQQEVELTSNSLSEKSVLNQSDRLVTENGNIKAGEITECPAGGLNETSLPGPSKQDVAARSKSLIMLLVKTLNSDRDGSLEVDESTKSNTALNRKLCLYRKTDPTPTEEEKNRHMYPTRTFSKSAKIGFLD